MMYSEEPVWKQLISDIFTAHERRRLVTAIFSDNNQAEMVGHLSGDNAQKFIDVIDEVSLATSCSKDKLADLSSNLHLFPTRWRMVSHQRSGGSVCAIYTISVATRPCFRNHWQFRCVTTRSNTQRALVDTRMCGRVNIMTERLQPRSYGYLQRTSMTLNRLKEWVAGGVLGLTHIQN